MNMKLLIILAATLALLASAVAQDPLADAARKARMQKKPATTAHVITNEEIPSADAPAMKSSAAKEADDAGSTPGAAPASAAAVKAQISAQKQRIARIQDHLLEVQHEMDRWKGSDCTHILHADTYKNACDVPRQLTQERDRTQRQLEQQRQILNGMQERARQQGFGNSISDPD